MNSATNAINIIIKQGNRQHYEVRVCGRAMIILMATINNLCIIDAFS
jgi:hypothetical protein